MTCERELDWADDPVITKAAVGFRKSIKTSGLAFARGRPVRRTQAPPKVPGDVFRGVPLRKRFAPMNFGKATPCEPTGTGSRSVWLMYAFGRKQTFGLTVRLAFDEHELVLAVASG